eukprot:Skav231487  [mRNA]  locus=scaffold820:371090:372376:+ [translate_table: standard]
MIAACLRICPWRIPLSAARPVASALLPSSVDVWTLDSQISHQRFLLKLEVIVKKLKQHLGKQEWPRLTHVDVGGVSLELPVRISSLKERRIPLLEADVQYLAGVFDGDGCVKPDSNLSGIQLSVGQSASNVQAIFPFLCKFGGSICLGSSGIGSRRPSVQWIVSGNAARAAVAELHEHCFVKREQLEIAMKWPECKTKREEFALKLKLLKMKQPEIEVDTAAKAVSWPYFAGLFDAEGCIEISSTSRVVQLRLSQRDPPILHAMRKFLLHHLPTYSLVSVRGSSQFGYTLRASSRKVVHHMLQEMLANGLSLKRTTAEHILRSIDNSHEVLRGSEPNVKGNQRFFIKLDTAGCRRAVRIQRLQTKCWRARNSGRAIASELSNQLMYAKLEHGILKAMTQIRRLRSAIATLESRAALGHCSSSLLSFHR